MIAVISVVIGLARIGTGRTVITFITEDVSEDRRLSARSTRSSHKRQADSQRPGSPESSFINRCNRLGYFYIGNTGTAVKCTLANGFQSIRKLYAGQASALAESIVADGLQCG